MEKPYMDKYKILVIDPGRIAAVMLLPMIENVDPCMAINAGKKNRTKKEAIMQKENMKKMGSETRWLKRNQKEVGKGTRS